MIETFDSMKAPTTAELEQIAADAMKAVARNLPTPFEVIARMPAPSRRALMDAYRAQDGDARHWRAREKDIHLLFPKGICDAHGFLTVFGMSVHRELMAVPQ